jgi:hypothetical protein
MKTLETIWNEIPPSLRAMRALRVCLKCGFDLLTRQMRLAPRTAYTEMRKYVPELSAFRANPPRPAFLSSEKAPGCPYCEAPKRWVASIIALELDGHTAIRKQTRDLIAAAKKKTEAYVVAKDTRSSVQVFSDWLERVSFSLNFEGEMWLRDAAVAYLERHEPTAEWEDIENVARIFLSRRLESGWEREGNRLYVAPSLYGDILVVQYLLGRTHLHGALTFEGRLTGFEFFHRLRRLGYLEKRGIEVDDPSAFLEDIIASLAGDGDIKPHTIIDRSSFLAQLKSLYDKLKKPKSG